MRRVLLGWAVAVGVVGGCDFDPGPSLAIDSRPNTNDGAIDSAIIIDSPVVIIDSGVPDARILCADVCTAGTCSGEVCTINCSGAGDCPNVTCPAGVACQVTCTGGGGSGTACETVTCAANQPCVVVCNGEDEANGAGCGEVACNGACSCDVSCSDGSGSVVGGGGTGCEQQTAGCPSGCDQNNGCDSTGPPPACNTCP